MDELIKTVSEKAGINAEQAKTAVNSVMDFIQTRMPGIGDQVKGMLTGEGGAGASGTVDNIRGQLGI